MAYGNHTFGVFFNGRPASASFNSVALTCRASKENLSWCIIICWILGVISIKCLLFNMGISSLWSVFYSEMQDQTQNLQTKKSILTDINASTTNFIALWWWLMQYSIYSNFLPVIFNPHWWLSSVYLIHLLLFNSLDIFFLPFLMLTDVLIRVSFKLDLLLFLQTMRSCNILLKQFAQELQLLSFFKSVNKS